MHRRLREVLACYFPEVGEAVDWSQPPQFLEQELRELAVDETSVENRVDLLVRAAMRDGRSQLLYLHIEVQSFKEEDFPRRLAHGNFRLRAGCGEDVITLAVLADLDPEWKPREYRHERLGCELFFRFPCCKLLEILPRLEGEDSLPALAAQAQVEALRTSRHPDKRLAARLRLTRKLYHAGYGKEEIREAFRLLAWMMQLPAPLYLTFRRELVAYEKDHQMTKLLDFEEYALQQGRQEGWQEGRQEGELHARRRDIIKALEIRFGRVPEGLREEVGRIGDIERLRTLHRTAILCSGIEEFATNL
ncbi:MAG: hypothetical protein LBK99_14840 [Opitutaceae bacterium]|nr:hypothetical protein [Opitutaceae bacterium]